MSRIPCLVMIVSLTGTANAQDITVQGYVDDFTGWAGQPLTETAPAPGHFQNALQQRLNTAYYPLPAVKVECDLRTRFIYQERLNAGGMFTSQLQGRSDLLNLNAVFVDRNDAVFLTQADRFLIDWTEGPVQLTLGRQRIAWGTNLVWNPTDLFNPFSVLDFDYEERPGVDALRAQLFTGPTSKIELACAPGKTSGERTALALVHLNARDYDFNFLAGAFQRGYIAGFSWAGQIADGGFRGETRWTGNQHAAGPGTYTGERLSYFSAALSGDYTFPNSFYIHSEVLFNGDGVSTNAGFSWAAALARGELSPARVSIYQEFAGDVSPLVRLSIFGLVNPDDGSAVVVPSLTWSVATNWDLLLIALVPEGQAAAEFSSTGPGAFARAKWSF